MKIKYLIYKIINSKGKKFFLLRMHQKYKNKNQILLDVGCGNNSVKSVKDYNPKCYYIGLDVGDYNLNSKNKALMEEYIVTSPENFAQEIEKRKDSIDVIISNHNIEHCNEPERVLEGMINALKPGGGIFLAFPSENSVNFPSRKGTLNFYDDKTHATVPDFNKIILKMREMGITIEYKCKNYKPIVYWMLGLIEEPISVKCSKVLRGTWAYWGFETVIWGYKHS